MAARPPRRRRAAALILVLGILAALGWLVASIVKETVRQQAESAAFTRREHLREAAWSAAECVAAALRERRLVAGELYALPADTAPLLTRAGFVAPRGLQVVVTLDDVSGKLGFARLDTDALRELLADHGVPADEAARLADTLLDRFSPGDSRRLLGMKRDDYLAAGLPPPPERPARHFAELLDAPGMAARFVGPDGLPADRFRDLASCLALDGDTVAPNLNTASPALLRHLRRAGVISDADALLRHRTGPDGLPGTDDDRVVRNAGELAAAGITTTGDTAAFTVRRVRLAVRVTFGESTFLLHLLADPTAESPGFPWKLLAQDEGVSGE